MLCSRDPLGGCQKSDQLHGAPAAAIRRAPRAGRGIAQGADRQTNETTRTNGSLWELQRPTGKSTCCRPPPDECRVHILGTNLGFLGCALIRVYGLRVCVHMCAIMRELFTAGFWHSTPPFPFSVPLVGYAWLRLSPARGGQVAGKKRND